MLCTHIFVCMHQLFLLFLLQMIFILFINKNYFIYKAYQKNNDHILKRILFT